MQRYSRCSVRDGSIENIEDIQNAIKEVELNLPQMNKSLLTKMLKGFVGIEKILVRQDAGIFQEVVKWCRLYTNMHISIDPKDTKLLELFERTAPAVISYIIAFLQYKAQESVNYHYSLLQIINSILQNLPPKILQFGFRLEPETIACLWKPIDLIGDFNVKLLTLKIFATLVKYLDDDKRNAVLNSPKFSGTNLLFRDKLNTVIHETPLMSVFEESCRELLNNYNTSFCGKSKIYSFNCRNVSIGKYDIYRTLNCDKLWIDFNFSSQLLSFKGRCRLGNEFKAQNIDVNLKVQYINLINNTLSVHIDQSHSISSPISIIADNSITVVTMHLSSTELKRFNDNPMLTSFTKKKNQDAEATEDEDSNNNNKDVFDKLRCEKPLNEVKKKPLKQISKSIRNCCKYLFDVSPSIDLVNKLEHFSTNEINCSDQQHNDNAFDSLNTAYDSPVSTKLPKSHIKNHPITQLRAKKRPISNTEDYTPSKKQRKKDTKFSSSAKSSGKRNQKNKKMPMKTLKATNNLVSASVRNLNASNVLSKGNTCDVGIQHFAGSSNAKCNLMVGGDFQNQLNNTSSLRKSATGINGNDRLDNDKHSAVKNSKTQSFKKPIEYTGDLKTLNQQSPKKQIATELCDANECESIEKDDSRLQNNESTENANLPDCEELRSTKFNGEESICSLPEVSKPTSGIGESVINLTLVTPIKHGEETIKKELAEYHELFALPKYWSQTIPVTPNSSMSIMTVSDINEPSRFIDSHNEFENYNEEFNLVNRILNDWETDSDNDDTSNNVIEDLNKIKEQESNLKTDAQNSRAISNKDHTALITIPINKSEDFFKITKEYQLKIQHNLHPLREQCLSKSSEIYKQQISKIAENILTESEEQRKELERFQENFKSLIIQMEGQCEIYMDRSKQYQIFQENMDCELNSLENNDLMAIIENEHTELKTQVSTTEYDVRQQVWQTYMENYRKSILTEMKTIPNLYYSKE